MYNILVSKREQPERTFTMSKNFLRIDYKANDVNEYVLLNADDADSVIAFMDYLASNGWETTGMEIVNA